MYLFSIKWEKTSREDSPVFYTKYKFYSNSANSNS